MAFITITLKTLQQDVFTVGLFVLLTGMFWLGDLGYLPTWFYLSMLLPALLLVVLKPKIFLEVARNPIFMAFLPFAAYMMATAIWSPMEHALSDAAKRFLFVTALFLVADQLAQNNFHRFINMLVTTIVIASIAAAYAVFTHYQTDPQGRMIGHGAFRNPLLTTHVFGFFLSLLLAMTAVFEKRKVLYLLPGLILLAAALFATGSRTPLLAAGAALIWIVATCQIRRAAYVLAICVAIGSLATAFRPDILLQRGLSFRPELWSAAMDSILLHPWFGHGYGTLLSTQLPELGYPLTDPHNISLLVLLHGGIVGFSLWTVLYVTAIYQAWRNRHDPWVVIFSAAVVSGLFASMTEGGGYISRPNERWFIIWIPLALLAAVIGRKGTHDAA